MNTKITLIAIAALFILPALSQNRDTRAPFAAEPKVSRPFNVKEDAAKTSDIQTLGVSITPNPSEGRFMIIVPEAAEMKVSIYNVLGGLVYKARSTAASSGNMLVDIAQHPAGVYLVKIETLNETLSRKIVVR